MKRGRPLRSVEGLAARVLRILKEGGPRKLTVLRGYCKFGAQELGLGINTNIIFERVVGILFLQGVVEWQGQKKARLLAARSA
jgi:hypothetical protein